MNYEVINFKEKFSKFEDQWAPKTIGQMNNYQFKVVKIQGEFVWHKHIDTDETFIVLKGDMSIDFRDRAVTLSQGEMFIIPKGVEHKPYAQKECEILLVEPEGVTNTGSVESELTAENDVWI